MVVTNKQQKHILSSSDLHCLRNDPALEAISFLNNIISRFPEAISFAPGAPYSEFFDDLDVSRYINRYINYLRQEKGLSLSQARRRLYQYGSSHGEINDLIANALLLDEGIHAAPEAIVVTVGCQEAMLVVLRALCASSNDILAVIQPCFVGILGAARFLNMEIQPINEVADGIDLNQLTNICQAAREKGKRIKALYIAPDFSNPSGTTLSLEMRYQLLEAAENEDFLLLEDSTYRFTAPPLKAYPSLKSLDKNTRVIYLGSFAKVCLPGARVGFIVADQLINDPCKRPRILAEELAAIKSVVTINTSPICQAIIGGMLLEQGCSLTSISRNKASFYQRNLYLLLEALKRHFQSESNFPYRISWNVPSGGFFIRMRLPIPVDQDLLYISASQYGVLWTPMDSFYPSNIECNELRLSCSYLTPEEIDEGIHRLSLFLRNCSAAQPRLARRPIS